MEEINRKNEYVSLIQSIHREMRESATHVVGPEDIVRFNREAYILSELTEIILNKTCQEIKQLADDGFQIKRISVNVSALELKLDEFCDDINRIIDDNEITGESIAIELTESNTEADFMIMKEKIVENLAHMFRDMDYSVLYEGVEDDVDEERCREMSASYLQGYKYSRPMPIEQLREFLPKAV